MLMSTQAVSRDFELCTNVDCEESTVSPYGANLLLMFFFVFYRHCNTLLNSFSKPKCS